MTTNKQDNASRAPVERCVIHEDLTMFYCPQCENETETLNEGYCEECREENQLRLDNHNFEYDFWQGLSQSERDERIKRACV